jgi:hypothetical protein
MSAKPPQAIEIDGHGDLQRYLEPESEVIQITIYRKAEPGPIKLRQSDDFARKNSRVGVLQQS